MINMIILITGDFGVGKDTVANILLEFYGHMGQLVQSYTTRKPRYEGEETHIFVAKDNTLEADKDVVAWTYIDGEYYWTNKNQFKSGAISVYVVDDCGINGVLKANMDKVCVIKVTRPLEMIRVDENRVNRVTQRDCPKSPVDYIINNDSGFTDLYKKVAEVYHKINHDYRLFNETITHSMILSDRGEKCTQNMKRICF